jgi:predicted permease
MASAVTALAAFVVGVLPAVWTSGHESSVIRARGSSGTQPHGRTAQHALVVVQVGLAIVLLTAGGLLGRTLQALQRLDLGFTTERVAMLQLVWPREKFDTGEKVAALYERLLPRIEALPDVISAAPVNIAPFSGALAGWDGWFLPEGRPDLERAPPLFNFAVVGAEYFRTLNVPVLRGRVFTDADREGSPRAAVVSEHAARRLWPGQDPIGKRLSVGKASTPRDWWTVVGLVPETRYRAFREPAPTVYVPTRQFVEVLTMVTTVAVRTNGEPTAALPSIRDALNQVDPTVLVASAAPLHELVSRQLARPRLSAALLGAFSLGALLLASVGLYAVLASVVRQRMREIAIRTALGASPARLRTMVLTQAAALAGTGIVLGLGTALVSGRFLESLLYEVRAADPATLAGVAAVLFAVSLIAADLPARRAARVDAMSLMREG